MSIRDTDKIIWRKPSGAPLSCTEKIKVLGQNLEELQQMMQDAMDDAVLMGGTAAQVREVMRGLVDALESSYPELDE
ncbi:MAG: hypothetical protein HYS20_12015 [Rhodocyclales bacterium]|nr:hypothetical protein [Rhodocyclales bacterium]